MESFIIDDDVSVSSKKVQDYYLPLQDSRHPSTISFKSRANKTSLGTLDDILTKRKTCPFCSLVVRSITGSRNDAIRNQQLRCEVICYASWELDGREATPHRQQRARGRTRRIHLTWSDKRLTDSYLIFVAPERYRRPKSDARSAWGNEALFLGRDIDTETGNQALMKSWLDLCCTSHPGPCSDAVEDSSEFADMLSQSYFGVVDVYDLQLKALPSKSEDSGVSSVHAGHRGRSAGPAARSPHIKAISPAPYAALSYVWGQGQPYTTKLSNIMLHRNHGGLQKFHGHLPRVIQDAIDLVRGLGIRYLWVDSLCIVQDSARSWNLNARVMDLIYGNAILTICAADGDDSSTGLKAMHATNDNVFKNTKQCAPGLRLMYHVLRRRALGRRNGIPEHGRFKSAYFLNAA